MSLEFSFLLQYVQSFTKKCLVNAFLPLLILLSAPAQVFSQQTDDYTSAYIGYHLNNFEFSEKIWTELALKGDMNSQYALGVMQLRGESTNSSPQNAYKWFSMAAEQGHSTAMFNVGVALWEGSGVEQDRPSALSWWEQAANKGDSGAQFNLGLAHYLGEEKDKDIEAAAKWISLAHKQNHPEAKRVLQAIIDENPNVAANIASQGTVAQNTTAQQTAQTAQPSASTTPKAEPSATQTAEAGTASYWKVVSPSKIYASPKNDSPSFSAFPADTPVEVLQTRGPWTKVTLPAGIKTWIYSKYLNINGKSGVISGTSVRVRPNASTDNVTSPPLGIYRNGDKVAVLSQSEPWTQIRAPKYIGGWIPTKNLTKYQDTPENRSKLWDEKVGEGL